MPESLGSESAFEINWAKPHRNKLKSGHLLGNRFTVTISGIEQSLEEALQRAEAIVSILREKGIPNFYGPQRFSGGNVDRGLEIIRGKRMGDRWLQRILVSSCQGFLCNRYLAERYKLGLFDRVIKGDIAKKYSTGGLFEVKDEQLEQKRFEAKEISFTAPIYGPKMWEARGHLANWRVGYSEYGITIEQLGKLGVKGTRRLGRLLLNDLTVEPVRDGIRLSFTLPKGAYATTVLREFTKSG